MSRILVSTALGLCLIGAVPAASPQSRAAFDVPPKVIKSVDPIFSEDAKENRIGGVVVVHVFIDEKGHVTGANVLRGIGHGLDEAAVTAVRKYVFKPATKDGEPVACDIAIDVHFNIVDGS